MSDEPDETTEFYEPSEAGAESPSEMSNEELRQEMMRLGRVGKRSSRFGELLSEYEHREDEEAGKPSEEEQASHFVSQGEIPLEPTTLEEAAKEFDQYRLEQGVNPEMKLSEVPEEAEERALKDALDSVYAGAASESAEKRLRELGLPVSKYRRLQTFVFPRGLQSLPFREYELPSKEEIPDKTANTLAYLTYDTPEVRARKRVARLDERRRAEALVKPRPNTLRAAGRAYVASHRLRNITRRPATVRRRKN